MPYRNILIAVIIMACALMQGCAGFRGNNIAHVNPADLKSASVAPLKVYSRWNVESKAEMNENIRTASAAIHKKNFETALATSSCCVIVESLNEADVVVSGTAHDENNRAALIPAFITGLSLFTIPSWVTAKVHITAEARTASQTRNYDLSDSMTMVQWLPLIVALPFANPITTGKEVDANTYNALVLNMKKDDVIR